MKVSMAATFCLLLIITTVALGSKSKSSSRVPHHPTECCFTYFTRKVPRHLIMDYYETSSQCSKPGVVFITTRGRSLCVNPSDNWVQDYIKELEEI